MCSLAVLYYKNYDLKCSNINGSRFDEVISKMYSLQTKKVIHSF